MDSFENMDGVIWVNGEMSPWSECRSHILNYGLHYANCVFEGIRVYSGKSLFLTDHIERLIESARSIGMEISFSIQRLEQAVNDLVKRQQINDGYVRPFIWLGSNDMAYAQNNPVNVAIAAWPWPDIFKQNSRMEGIKVKTSEWRRPMPGTMPFTAKCSASYLIGTMAKRTANSQGYDDALMLTYDGLVAEASGANIFFVVNRDLYTPLPKCFLNGLTRQAVITLASYMGVEVHERDLPLSILNKSQEVFLTGTAYEIQPIKRIDNINYESREITEKIVDSYKKLTHGKAVPQSLKSIGKSSDLHAEGAVYG